MNETIRRRHVTLAEALPALPGERRFVDFPDDLAVWAMFNGPAGGDGQGTAAVEP